MGKAAGGDGAGLFGDDEAVLDELARALNLVVQRLLVRVVPCRFVEGSSSPGDGRVFSRVVTGLSVVTMP